ncbi:hypothetical protein [Streptomyces sp. NPDC039016]|uniref:hypothetical protein n=1 Tax=Streptomyces sp. NPDC039016 TaxID=3154330 RepID=UPI00340FE484
MRAAALLTGLYPPAIREHWGAELSREVAAAGIRSWPDTLAGAARLWLHPGDWPESTAGQTRRVVAVAAFAVTAVAALLLRANQPSAALTPDARHAATALWLVPVLCGIGLAAPLPALCAGALRRLARTAAGALTAPACAVLALYLTARSGLVDHLTGAAHLVPVLCYWSVLGFTALRTCALVARIARTAAPPSTRRLRAALHLIGTGLALAAVQSLLDGVRAAPHLGALTATGTLGLLAAVTLGVGRDLRTGRAV